MIKNLLGIGPKVNITELIANGAMILDVRTELEFAAGHARNAKNIPLQVLRQKINMFPKDTAIITCCASGMRSAAAKNILLENGFTRVYNGGSWSSLE